MDISKLNQRIQIQKAILKTDEVGNVIQQWQDFYSCFASVNTAGGKERQKGDTYRRRKGTAERRYGRTADSIFYCTFLQKAFGTFCCGV